MSRVRFAVYTVLGLYWAVLTVLLLVPNPWRLLGFSGPPGGGPDRGVHTLMLCGLTLLAHLVRWPHALNWRLPALLIGYALTTETLQSLVPPRTVDFWDYFENCLGIVLGTLTYALVWRRAAAKRRFIRPCVAEDE